MLWNLVSLRAETLPVAYLDDSSLHEQMVRFATAQLGAGHLPQASWFPYLGLGSPQFLHYQSLPATLAGALGLLIGPGAAFRWTLYLLLSLWPVSVYAAARLFGAGRGAAASAAAMAPFLVSVTGVGYEQHAYVWIGYGLWTQLWASFTLPLAWGFGWSAVRTGRGLAAAVALTALTVAFHYETGYLALAVLPLWPLAAGRPFAPRVRRAGLILAGSLLAAAWVIVPLLAQRDWAATNELLRGTPLEDGYGIARVLGWLATGQLLDHGRLPVVTAFAWIGAGVTAVRARRADPDARALLFALAAALLLSSGRATFGGLVGVIPGAGDLFLRRFMMGVQLAALLLAGRGAGRLAVATRQALLRARRAHDPTWIGPGARGRRLLAAGAVGALVAVLAPAWSQLDAYDARNAAAIAGQRAADATEGTELGRLLAVVRRAGGGRVYAGLPTNWGASFTVGAVPVFKYLERRDIDEVGYTLRTASLMTDPEAYFDEREPGDYRLFGIRYLILPAGRPPPVPARRLGRSGPYVLWTIPGGGYIQAGTTVGALAADRTDVGRRSVALLHSDLAGHGEYLKLRFDRPAPRRAPASPSVGFTTPTMTLSAQHAALARGLVSATVTLGRPGVAVLSASLDPGWSVTVDGRPGRIEPIAPALVGVALAAGRHRVTFRYRGYGAYPPLLALSGLSLLAWFVLPGRWRGRLRDGRTPGLGPPPTCKPSRSPSASSGSFSGSIGLPRRSASSAGPEGGRAGSGCAE